MRLGCLGRQTRLRTGATVVALGAVLAAAVSAGCGVIRFGDLDPPEGRQMIVGVEITGNDGLSDGAITDLLATYADNLSTGSDKPLLDRSELPQDAQRIESIYAAHGYFSAHVTGYEVIPDEADPDLVRVRFSVIEGEPTIVEERTVTDFVAEAPPDPEAQERLQEVQDDLDSLLPLEEGEVFDEEEHVTGKEQLRKALRDQGFIYAEVIGEVLVAKETHDARVTYYVIPGPLTRASEVQIAGNERVSDERIQRRVEIEPGEVVSDDVLRLTERHIYGLRVFFGVSAVAQRPSLAEKLGDQPATVDNIRALEWDPLVPVVITVQEMPEHELVTGVGTTIDNERSEVYVRGGYKNRDFLGGLRYLDTEVRPALVAIPSFWDADATYAPGGQALLTFRQPSFIEEYVDLGLHGNYELEVEEGYRAHKVFGAPSISRPWYGWLTTTLSYNVMYVSYFSFQDVLNRPVADELGVGFSDTTLLTYWEQLVEVDFRDSIYDPRSGFYGSVRLAESLKATGSDFFYFRLLTNVRTYWTPWDWLTLAWQVNYGQTFSPFGANTPLPARFRAGGPSDMRGFGAGRMGPFLCDVSDAAENRGETDFFATDDVGCDGDKVFVGGELMLTASFEMRFYLPSNFGLVAFVDAGEVWESKDDVDLSDTNVAVGPGLRYYTPFGPIRADFGVLVTEPDPGKLTFHISIGQAF